MIRLQNRDIPSLRNRCFYDHSRTFKSQSLIKRIAENRSAQKSTSAMYQLLASNKMEKIPINMDNFTFYQKLRPFKTLVPSH